MANDTQITIIGNLTADPELRFTPAGKAVANFTVAATPRYFDRQTQAWRDGETLFMRCAIWNADAENLVESAYQGQRVIVTGRLKQRSFETREGDKRTVVEMEADEIGPSLKFGTTVYTKSDRSYGGGGGQQDDGENWASQRQGGRQDSRQDRRQPDRRQGGQQNRGGQQSRPPARRVDDDPWGTAPAVGNYDPDDEPPF